MRSKPEAFLPSRRATLVAMLSTAALYGMVLPAAATGEAGAGAGVGSETNMQTEPANPAPNPPFCLQVKDSHYELTATGTVTADDTAIVYEGTDITIGYGTTERYYISPEGTYGERNADGTCNVNTFGPNGSVDVSVTVNAAGDASSGVGTGADGVPAASRNCAGTGQYYRVNTTVVVTWTANCAVDGNVPGKDGAAVESATQFRFEGNLAPTGELEGAYSQT